MHVFERDLQIVDDLLDNTVHHALLLLLFFLGLDQVIEQLLGHLTDQALLLLVGGLKSLNCLPIARISQRLDNNPDVAHFDNHWLRA